MKRRDFIVGLGAAAAVWPLGAKAQQPAVPVVGFLDLSPPRPNARYAEFRRGLAEAGFVEGQTVVIEYCWAADQGPALLVDRLPNDRPPARFLAAELVQRQVAAIVALGGPTIVAAESATSTIPIVFATQTDPVKRGWVASLSHPGGNMTGVSLLSDELTQKRLGLLREMAPMATIVACLCDPRIPRSEELTSGIVAAAGALGRQVIILEARKQPDIDAAFAIVAKRGAGALVVTPAALFATNGKKIIELAARHNMPAIYPNRGYVVDGGLMSYDADILASARQIGLLYVAQILRGVKPADLPVQQPTKFEFVINLKTAKALGLTVPNTLLAIADEVIE
jgi:putative ABC transport system substrate-binding protein